MRYVCNFTQMFPIENGIKLIWNSKTSKSTSFAMSWSKHSFLFEMLLIICFAIANNRKIYRRSHISKSSSKNHISVYFFASLILNVWQVVWQKNLHSIESVFYMQRLDRYLRVHIENLNLWKIYEKLPQFLLWYIASIKVKI